ncbi:hypothetical protein TNCV_672471 [Trichonephila clavipes]|nr:hypothetical protein TNCV_672471 [Trichonephila clavipes]
MEVQWSARRVARQLGRSDCVVREVLGQWIRDVFYTKTRPGTPSTDQSLRRPPRREKCTYSQLLHRPPSSDKSRFNLSSDDNVFVCGDPGERINPAFALQRHTTTAGRIAVAGAIGSQYMVTPSIGQWHHDSPAVCP